MFGKRDVIVHGTDPFNAETEPRGAGRGRGHGDRRLLRAQPRRRAGVDAGDVAPARQRARSSAPLDLLARDAARGVPRAHGDGHAAVRGQPPRRADRRSATSPARRRGARARPAPRRWTGARWPTCSRSPGRRARPPRGVRGRRPEPGGRSRRSGSAARSRSTRPPPRGAARVGDERRAAARPSTARRCGSSCRATSARAASSGSTGSSCARPRGRATSSRSSTGCCPRTATPGPGAGMPLGLVALNADILAPADGATVPPARSRCAATRSPAASATSRASTSRSTAARRWSQAELLEDLGRWAWRHWRADARPRAGRARDRRPRLGLARRPPSPRTRPRSGTRRATSTTRAPA